MRITCTKENLNKNLELVSHVTTRGTNLPILANVLIRAKGGVIELITTDLEVGIKSTIRGKIDEEGEFTLPATLFSNYIGLARAERITLIREDKEICVQTEDATTRIKGELADEFPLLPEVKRDVAYTVVARDFVEALGRVFFACAQDETRPEISGVFCTVREGVVVLAATDSYRLAEAHIPLTSTQSPFSCIIPAKTVQELMRILHAKGDDTLQFYVNENQILFVVGDIELISRLVEGQYPDYTQLIPATFQTQTTLTTRELTQIIKTTSLFAKSGINDISFHFVPKDKLVLVEAVNNQLGENKAKIQSTIEGKETTVVFNYRYLLDGLSALPGDECLFLVTDGTSPALLRPQGDTGYLYLIMPIRQ